MKLKILYEDKNILVVDKPAGISVHPDVHTKKNCKTLVDYILEYDPKIKNVGEPLVTEYKGKNIIIDRPGIVHRLDKETSGVLLVARNQKAFLFLKEQFQNHTIKKKYLTFVYGYVPDPKASLLSGKRGVINAPIGRSPKDIRMWTAGCGAKEPLRSAFTEYIIIKKFSDTKEKTLNQENNFSYLEVYPKTGRTHQIRIHMRYINHPVVSDPLYRGNRNLALGMKRLALHSNSVTFKLLNGDIKTIESPLPVDFKKVVKKYSL